MASLLTSYVHQGSYIDYGRGIMAKHQWLWSTSYAGIWTNFLGILVTIALARLLKILWRMDSLAADYAAIHNPTRQGTQPKHILFALEDDAKEPTLEGLGWDMLLTIYEKINHGANRLRGARRLNKCRNIAFLFTGGILLLSTYVGVIVFGILMSLLATDTTALSTSPNCGLYSPASSDLGDSYKTYAITQPYELDTQVASATLVKQCYHTVDGADGCNLFLQQSIDYDTMHNVSCPFPRDMCYNGESGAVKFSTPPVSSRAIGVNSLKKYEFQRNTTCSPLNMNKTFIQLHKDNDQNTLSYHYGPGPASLGKEGWTWRTDGYGSNLGQPPFYLVGAMVASALTARQAWDPIPELHPHDGESVTIIFVLPQKIYYLSPSTDPIFPANQKVFLPNISRPFWLYTGGHATVLACLDKTSWRDPEQGPTWHSLPKQPPSVTDPGVPGSLWLFMCSIRNSRTYSVISERLGYALNATDRLSAFTSLPLAIEQWKVEARRFFETSLARTQIDAWNIARGVMASYPGYVKSDITPPKMCEGTYLFTSVGWTNVNKAVSLVVLVPSVLVLILACPIHTETHNEKIVLEILLGDLAMPFGAVVIYGVIKFGELVGKVFSKQPWFAVGGYIGGVFTSFVASIKGGARQVKITILRFWCWIAHW